jgi:hypothetical protein
MEPRQMPQVFQWETAALPVLGSIKMPIAEVFLRNASGEWRKFFPVVDSGAAISFFSKSECEFLGYPFNAGDYCELTSLSGHAIPCRIHKVPMKVGTEVIEAMIAFSDTLPHKQYLGRISVFENFEINFRGRVSTTTFVREV